MCVKTCRLYRRLGSELYVHFYLFYARCSSPRPVVKYIALLAMTKIAPSHPHLLADYQDTILASVNDQDVSIRMRALDLVSAMVRAFTDQSASLILSLILRQIFRSTGKTSSPLSNRSCLTFCQTHHPRHYQVLSNHLRNTRLPKPLQTLKPRHLLADRPPTDLFSASEFWACVHNRPTATLRTSSGIFQFLSTLHTSRTSM